jgi:hypothetical protein
MKRGDVVRLDFPFTDIPGAKKRPSHLLIDPSTPEGASSGLNGPSLVSCNNLYTVDQACILQVLGPFPVSSSNSSMTA